MVKGAGMARPLLVTDPRLATMPMVKEAAAAGSAETVCGSQMRCTSSGGTAAISAFVYQCLGAANTASVSPASTTSPRYITITRSQR